MLIQTARDIPDAIRLLASDLRRLGQSAWADRLTLAVAMRKEGRELVAAADEVLEELTQTPLPRELGYRHRMAAMRHALSALRIGHRVKPSTLQQVSEKAVWHEEGFGVRYLDTHVVYNEGARQVRIPLEAAEGGAICRLDMLRWSGAAEAMASPMREVIQHRVIAALLFLGMPCRIYCD
jgi:hypothetical protein